MLQRLEELAHAEGKTCLSLDTAKMMDRLVNLYTKFGFRIVHEGLPQHGKDPHLRVTMEKSLL